MTPRKYLFFPTRSHAKVIDWFLVFGFCRVSILMKTIYSPSKRTICRRGGRQTVSRHFCSRNAALPIDLPRLVFPFEGDQSRVKIFRVCSVSRRWRGRGITTSAADDVCLRVGLVFSFNHYSVNIGSLGGSFRSQGAGSEYRYQSLCLSKASISFDGTG